MRMSTVRAATARSNVFDGSQIGLESTGRTGTLETLSVIVENAT